MLNYLDGNWIPEEIEYELFDWALGDNEQNKFAINVPNIRGITANMLHRLTRTLQDFNFIRRREREMSSPLDDSNTPEVIVFYKLTNTGRKLRDLLKYLVEGKCKIIEVKTIL